MSGSERRSREWECAERKANLVAHASSSKYGHGITRGKEKCEEAGEELQDSAHYRQASGTCKRPTMGRWWAELLGRWWLELSAFPIWQAVLSMDVDGDGSIAEAEFVHGMAQLSIGSAAVARTLFHALDADGSGELETAELEVLLFGSPLSAERREVMLLAARRDVRHQHRDVSDNQVTAVQM